MFKVSTDKSDRDKFDADHETALGIFVGWDTRTTEPLLITEDNNIYRARNVRRLTGDKAYDPACLEHTKAPDTIEQEPRPRSRRRGTSSRRSRSCTCNASP